MNVFLNQAHFTLNPAAPDRFTPAASLQHANLDIETAVTTQTVTIVPLHTSPPGSSWREAAVETEVGRDVYVHQFCSVECN